ncbi:hypothetical protein C8R46DRAFT_1035608 [Mycena filopes]|nr:hypothetical protein C8R46DRAFT_1035608 [Mycena filopes]
MFTKFITISVLFAAPLLSAAAPAPGLFNLGTTVTIFRCPASASASPSAVVPVAGGGGALDDVVPAASQVTDVLTALRQLNSLLGGLPSTISGVTSTVNSLTNLLSGVTGALTGFTGQINQVQNQVNGVGAQLTNIAGLLSALPTTTPNTGSNTADPFNGIQSALSGLTSIVPQLNALTTAAQGAGSNIDMGTVQQALQAVTSQCIIVIPNLSNQFATSAEKKLINDAWKILPSVFVIIWEMGNFSGIKIPAELAKARIGKSKNS